MKYLLLFIFFGSLLSCVPDETSEPIDDTSHEYFPLSPGKYITYQVDSIIIDDQPGGNKKDISHFQIKEEITETHVFNGDTLYYIHRSRRDNPSQSWNTTDVWISQRTSVEALKTEENITFRKLVFPLKEGRRWIATSYINPLTTVLIGTEYVQAYQDWQAEVVAYDVSDQVGNIAFENDIMHVSQTDTDDGITKRYVFEKYARGIGLVYRTDTILDSRCIVLGDFTPCLGKEWLDHAGKGYILSQVMIDHN